MVHLPGPTRIKPLSATSCVAAKNSLFCEVRSIIFTLSESRHSAFFIHLLFGVSVRPGADLSSIGPVLESAYLFDGKGEGRWVMPTAASFDLGSEVNYSILTGLLLFSD
jgi:hypothetical protein